MKKNKKIETDKKVKIRSDNIDNVTIIFASKKVYTNVKNGVTKNIFQLNGSVISMVKIIIVIIT